MEAHIAEIPVEKKAVVRSLSLRLVPRLKEKAIELLLQLAAFTSVAITLGIVGVLAYESFHFFQQVSVVEFLTDRQWTPLFADAHYGILSLVSGTLVTTAVALLVAIPMGS
ncbi:MAG: phosphate ABC transporter permease subunit PstC, partial [Nitrospirota bacterium]